ncbi:spore germination protein [Gracilibacillus sp. YIM 98692]|uniref:spore germination protein n=1 Tax=Gracilibacillus sp. YIM 98692 TaxID=2663532 RepID=UPI0013D542EA|nr:spore germination protein [Gracilibacillus sp. YIM 98692]
MRNIRQALHNRLVKSNHSSSKNDDNKSLTPSVKINIKWLKEALKNSADIIHREFGIIKNNNTDTAIFYIDGIVDNDYINRYIIVPLMDMEQKQEKNITIDHLLNHLLDKVLPSSNVKVVHNLNEVIHGVLVGKTVLFLENHQSAILVNTISYDSRPIEEPDTESTVRGSREGFNEVLNTNTSLIRRKIVNPDLVFEEKVIGKQTQTRIRIAYIDGIVNQEIVEEVRKRINQIDTDMVLESGYIEQFIEDTPSSLFPTVGNSEKSDKIAAKLLEGRVAIFCDGTPFVITVPYLFIESLQVPEDYYSRPFISSFVRLLRLLALFLTISTPGVFVSVATYHHEMVPTQLLITMAAAQERVPFPSFLETLIMITIFQLLREAGVRMPRPVGSAISIVGALVIGEAAVQAGLVGAPTVIVVALTAITGFVVSALNNTVIILRYVILFLAGGLGFYGILLGALVIVGHLCSLRSFGSPYLSPFAPVFFKEWKDALIRMPLWSLNKRPESVIWEPQRRQDDYNNRK